MDIEDFVSIAECARRLGLHRPKVSTIVAKYKIPKTKNGNENLVPFSEVQKCVQMEAMKGGVRTPVRKEIQTDDGTVRKLLEEQIRDLKEANKELKTENVKLKDRVDSLVAVETELKLLKAGLDKDHDEDKTKRKGASSGVDIKKRASMAINILLGKD
jgi:regulator of replication initiation timing